jgi:hypothetical protein
MVFKITFIFIIFFLRFVLVDLEKSLKYWNELYWKVKFHDINSIWVSLGICTYKNYS